MSAISSAIVSLHSAPVCGPRHELVDPAGRMALGDFGKRVAQMSSRVDAVEFGRLDDDVE